MANRIIGELPGIGYASGNFGKNLLWSAGDITFLFLLTELFGIPPLLAGALLLGSFAVDILIDMVAGRLAAGGVARGLGYRRRMLIAAPLCAAGFALLYGLPLASDVSAWAVVAALLLFRLGYGLVDVPHNALLAIVATDSRHRSRIAGYRSLFSSLAGIAVAALLAPAVIAAATTGETWLTATWGLLSALLFVLAILVAWGATAGLEPPRSALVPDAIPLLPRLRGDLLRLLAVALIAGFAMPMLGRNMLHLARYAYGDADAAARLLTAITVGQIAGIAIWMWLAHKAEKRTAMLVANLGAAASVSWLAFAPPDWRLAAAAVAGAALAGVFMLPWAVIGDIVDADHLRDGERREAQSIAAVLVALKGGAALGLLVSGWVLQRAGIGAGGAPLVPELVQGLAFLPVVAGGLLSALLIRKLGISHAEHARVQDALRLRRPAGQDHASSNRA